MGPLSCLKYRRRGFSFKETSTDRKVQIQINYFPWRVTQSISDSDLSWNILRSDVFLFWSEEGCCLRFIVLFFRGIIQVGSYLCPGIRLAHTSLPGWWTWSKSLMLKQVSRCTLFLKLFVSENIQAEPFFNLSLGHATKRMLVERGVGASKSREVVVWSVVFLSDCTVVSGDSAGKVQIWDSLTGTLVRTHLVTKWDVLSLSLSPVSVESIRISVSPTLAFRTNDVTCV